MATPAKVIYFTATGVPTPQELADIEKLEARSMPRGTLSIRTANRSNEYGTGRPEECDAVGGTIPPEYAGYDTVNPDADFMELTDGMAIIVTNAPGTSTADGYADISPAPALPKAVLPGNVALAHNGNTVVATGAGTTAELIVTNGVLVSVALT